MENISQQEGQSRKTPEDKLRAEFLFGKLLVDSCIALKKRIEDIAKESHIPFTTLYAWENSTALPELTPDKLDTLSRVYKIDPEEITNVLRISKEARRTFRGAKKDLKIGEQRSY